MNVFIVQFENMDQLVIRATTRSSAKYKAFKKYGLDSIFKFTDMFKRKWSIKKHRTISKEDFYPASSFEKRLFYEMVQRYNLDVSLGDPVSINFDSGWVDGYIVGSTPNLKIKIWIFSMDQIRSLDPVGDQIKYW